MTSSANSSPRRSDRVDETPDARKLAVRRAAEAAAATFPALMIEAERVAVAASAGLHGRRRAGPGESFWQHRLYAFGDPVSAIDWRQSARSADRLYVRQNEWEAAAAVWIWRDPSPSFLYQSTDKIPDKRRRADVLAVAVSILLAQAGERIGLAGRRRRAFSGRGAPALVLEGLHAPDAKATSEPPPVDAGAGARVVYFGDFFADPEAVARTVSASAATGAGGALVQIVDPAEEDFPFSGRLEFADMESSSRLLFGDAAAARAAYRDKFAGHRAALADACRRYGWAFLSHRTDRPAQHCLLALYAALEKRRGS
jgi:uncharacterized protein (DUF58 family)